MHTQQQQRFNLLYEQHLINLTPQGKRPTTIDGYSRAVRRISTYFDRNGLQFVDRYRLDIHLMSLIEVQS
ncbi:MAG: hypothetical protein HRT96_14735 [Moritella sp.]|nr:hypothetical protein [Moritella sp.]